MCWGWREPFLGLGGLIPSAAFLLMATCFEGDEEWDASFWGTELPPGVGEASEVPLAASGCEVGAATFEGMANSLENLLTIANTTRFAKTG